MSVFVSLRAVALVWAGKVKTIARNQEVQRDRLSTIELHSEELNDQDAWAETFSKTLMKAKRSAKGQTFRFRAHARKHSSIGFMHN